MQKSKNPMLSILMEALDFSYAELEANRQHYMTYEQRNNLRKKLVDQKFLSSGLILFCIFIIGITILAASVDGDVMCLYPLVIPIFGITIIIVLAGISDYSKMFSRDLKKGYVESLEGIVTKRDMVKESSKNTYHTYFLDIEDETFEVSSKVFKAFIYSECYVIYYAPHTRTILSAEPCDNSEGAL